MVDNFILAPEVKQDLSDAYRWYESQRTGLGEDFLSRIELCFESLRNAPESNAVVHKNYRRALVRKFPYAVFYELNDKVITVYCVFHTSRDPDKWRRRLS